PARIQPTTACTLPSTRASQYSSSGGSSSTDASIPAPRHRSTAVRATARAVSSPSGTPTTSVSGTPARARVPSGRAGAFVVPCSGVALVGAAVSDVVSEVSVSDPSVSGVPGFGASGSAGTGGTAGGTGRYPAAARRSRACSRGSRGGIVLVYPGSDG